MVKGVHLIKGKEPLLRRVVCEVRFRDGHLYLDHCGRLLKKLVNSSPEWILGNEATPGGAQAFQMASGSALAFSRHSTSLSMDYTTADETIEDTQVEQFAEVADDAFGLIFDELEVKEWSRIGYRESYHFSCESKAEAFRWLTELGLVTVSATLPGSFQGTPQAIELSFELEGTDCSYRIGLGGIERAAQVPIGDATLTVRPSLLPEKQKDVLKQKLKQQRQRQINAAFAALIDIDAYRENPVEVEPGSFIRECNTENLHRVRAAIPTTNNKKGK
jgi:hypothetical protein